MSAPVRLLSRKTPLYFDSGETQITALQRRSRSTFTCPGKGTASFHGICTHRATNDTVHDPTYGLRIRKGGACSSRRRFISPNSKSSNSTSYGDRPAQRALSWSVVQSTTTFAESRNMASNTPRFHHLLATLERFVRDNVPVRL